MGYTETSTTFDHNVDKILTTPVQASPFQRFRAGEHSAFDQFVAEYTGPAYATALQVLKVPARAEEAVQDAFVRLWQRAGQFDPDRGTERSWVLAIVRNSAIDALRKQGRTFERSIDDAPSVYALRDPDDVWQRVLEGLTSTDVRAALQQLPAEQQEIVLKVYYEGNRPVEVARELGIAEGTVRSRLRLALGKLREALGPVREDLEP